MEAMEKLEKSRNQALTRLLMFPEWFDKTEWEVYEYLQGSNMCKEKGLTIDWFNVVSFENFEPCQIKKIWVIQAKAMQHGKPQRTITLKRKK